MAASTGPLTAVQPRFPERLSAVAGGGVLAALPMLLREGLLKRAHEFLELPKDRLPRRDAHDGGRGGGPRPAARPRPHLKALFQSDADILPDPEQGILRVRILGTACNASDAALAGLLAQLNQTRTCFPCTSLRLVYELPPNPSLTPASGSRS